MPSTYRCFLGAFVDPLQSCTPGEIFGNRACSELDVPAVPRGSFCSAPLVPSLGWDVLGLHGEDEGLCMLSCWEGAPGAEIFLSQNVLGTIRVILLQLFAFYPLKAGGIKEGKLMQSSRKVGSSKLCYCSSTVLVISGFLLEFWGETEETRGERVSEGWSSCLFSLLSVSHPRPQCPPSSPCPSPSFVVWQLQFGVSRCAGAPLSCPAGHSGSAHEEHWELSGATALPVPTDPCAPEWLCLQRSGCHLHAVKYPWDWSFPCPGALWDHPGHTWVSGVLRPRDSLGFLHLCGDA